MKKSINFRCNFWEIGSQQSHKFWRDNIQYTLCHFFLSILKDKGMTSDIMVKTGPKIPDLTIKGLATTVI